MGTLVDRIKTMLDFSRNNRKTATGQPADEIEVNPVSSSIRESKEKHAVFTFGRFNPPTTGHQKLIDAVKNVAAKQGAEHHIFASHTQDPKKNPLSHPEKIHFMKKMFPDTNIHSGNDVRTALDAAKHLQHRGVTHATMVVGSDRVDEFHRLLSTYNKHPSDPAFDPKKHFHIPHLTVVSAGHRDPDAEGVEGMSASKMRDHAVNGNYQLFKQGVPNKAHAQDMYNTVRKNMGIKEGLDFQSMLNKRADSQKVLSKKEDEDGLKTATHKPIGHTIKTKAVIKPPLPASMTQNPYESKTYYNYLIPYKNNKKNTMGGDVGLDTNLKTKDIAKQLKRDQALKRDRTDIDEDFGPTSGYDPGSSQPTPVNVPIPTVQKKALVKPNLKTVKEAGMFGDVSLGTSDERPSAFASSQLSNTLPSATKKVRKEKKVITNEDAYYKVGDIVKPTMGPHAGQKHEIIHIHADGHYNIKPKDLHPDEIQYADGAVKTTPEYFFKESLTEQLKARFNGC